MPRTCWSLPSQRCMNRSTSQVNPATIETATVEDAKDLIPPSQHRMNRSTFQVNPVTIKEKTLHPNAQTYSKIGVVTNVQEHTSWLTCTNTLNKSCCGWLARTNVMTNLHEIASWLTCTNILNKSCCVLHARTTSVVVANMHEHTQQELSCLTCMYNKRCRG